MRRQRKIQLVKKDALVHVGLGVTTQDQGAPIGGREMHIEHLQGRELVEHAAWRKPRGQGLESRAQRDVQTVGDKGDKDMRLNAALELW